MQWGRSITAAVVAIAIFAVIAVQSFVFASDPASTIDSTSTIEGPLRVEMSLSPEINQPGDEITLSLSVFNDSQQDSAPEVAITVPEGIAFDALNLPSSTTLNLQTNRLQWSPLVPRGQNRQFEFTFRVDVVDMTAPTKEIVAVVTNNQNTQNISAEFWTGVLPQARIISSDQVSVGQPFRIIANTSGPGPFEQEWDLGDGRLFKAENPTIIFASTGLHDIALHVENPLGSVTTNKQINVVPEPAASFSIIDTTLTVGQEVSIVNQSGGAAPLNYLWDFGDGSTSREIAPNYAFAEPGLYEITLTLSNAYGESQLILPVLVGNPPEANMTISAETTVGESIIGQALGDDTVDAYSWDMGDGTTIDGKQAEHTYTQSGTFVVALTASNQFGDTRLARVVEVAPGTIELFLPVVVNAVAELAETTQDARPDYLINYEPIDLDLASVPIEYNQTERLLWFINKARQSVGLNELTPVETLSLAAQRHTNDMAFNDFRSHTGSDGSRPAGRLNAAGYDGNYAGEATAWGFEFPSDAVQFWLSSPSHRPIILNDKATQVGVGYTRHWDASSVYYWTAEFGSLENENPLPQYPNQGERADQPTAAPLPQPVVTPIPPQPTAIPTIQPTAEVLTPVPTNEPEPTAETVEPTIAQATPTATPTEYSAEPTTEPFATPTAIPTKTPEATEAPTEEPTALPTITPTPTETPTTAPIVAPATATPTVTPLPQATSTPSPTPTLEPTATPESSSGNRGPIAPATATPTPNPISNPGSAAAAFIEAFWADRSGQRSAIFATDNMQAQLNQNGPLAVMQLDDYPVSYYVFDHSETLEAARLWVRLTDASGAVNERLFVVVNQFGNWRVDAIEAAE